MAGADSGDAGRCVNVGCHRLTTTGPRVTHEGPERPSVANRRTCVRIFDAHLDPEPRDDDDLDNLSWFDTVDALVVPGPRGGLERAVL